MAVLALQHGVRAHQRKSILVIADLLDRDLPALHRVAALAVRAELAAMNIRMAVRAMRAYVLESQIRVAFGARHLLVHASQRIAGLIVIEFGVRTDRLPAGVGVTALARDRQGTVRIGHLGLRTSDGRSSGFLRLLPGGSSQKGAQTQQCYYQQTTDSHP